MSLAVIKQNFKLILSKLHVTAQKYFFFHLLRIFIPLVYNVKIKDKKSNEKAMNRNWSNQKAIPLSKPKWEITKINNRQNTIRINGQPSGQLFPKRWSLSYPNRTKSTMICMISNMVLTYRWANKWSIRVSSWKHVCEMNTPLTHHFYIVKLGFTGVYIIFLFLLRNMDCGYSLEPPRYIFWAQIRKISNIFI